MIVIRSSSVRIVLRCLRLNSHFSNRRSIESLVQHHHKQSLGNFFISWTQSACSARASLPSLILSISRRPICSSSHRYSQQEQQSERSERNNENFAVDENKKILEDYLKNEADVNSFDPEIFDPIDAYEIDGRYPSRAYSTTAVKGQTDDVIANSASGKETEAKLRQKLEESLVVMIHGLPFGCVEEEVRSFLPKACREHIRCIQFLYNWRGYRNGQAFVEFSQKDFVDLAANTSGLLRPNQRRITEVMRCSRERMNELVHRFGPAALARANSALLLIAFIPRTASEDVIAEYLEGIKFHRDSIKILFDARNYPCAFVRFADTEEVAKAIKRTFEQPLKFSGYGPRMLFSRPVKAFPVSQAEFAAFEKGKLMIENVTELFSSPKMGGSDTVRILGLPRDVTKAEIAQFFSAEQLNPTSVRQGASKVNNYALVAFASSEEAYEALRLNKKLFRDNWFARVYPVSSEELFGQSPPRASPAPPDSNFSSTRRPPDRDPGPPDHLDRAGIPAASRRAVPRWPDDRGHVTMTQQNSSIHETVATGCHDDPSNAMRTQQNSSMHDAARDFLDDGEIPQAATPLEFRDGRLAVPRWHDDRGHVTLTQQNPAMLEMRGLPHSATPADVVAFFAPIRLRSVRFLMDVRGGPCGNVDVEFCLSSDAMEALRKDGCLLGSSPVELSFGR